jgi:hypothetical protein
MKPARAGLAVALVLLGPSRAPSADSEGTVVPFLPPAPRSPTSTHEAQLLASDGSASDAFAVSVSISGDTAVVGAPFDDTTGGANAGSAYVFLRSGGVWTQQQRLQASDGSADDNFGSSVSIAGDTVVIGTPLDDPPGGVDAGSAYVFVRSGGVWTEQQKLLASDGAALDRFGFSVAVFADTVVVGAPDADTPASFAGSVYVFVRSGTTWSEQQKLLGSGQSSNNFGRSVSISGDTLVGGAPFHPVGRAFVYVRSGTAWSLQQTLISFDGLLGDNFGRSVSVSGDTAVIGAPGFDFPGAFNAGQAYVFVRSGTTWSEQQRLKASDASGGDIFGDSVSLDGDTVVVGASQDDTPGGADAGSGYVFERIATTWTELRRLLAPDGAAGDRFASAVSVYGNTAVAGAPGDDTPGGVDAGSAHVFRDLVAVELEALTVE